MAATALTLGACGDGSDDAAPEVAATQEAEESGVEPGEAADEPLAESPYDGPYDAQFYEDLDTRDSEQVTVAARVDEVLTERAFSITDTEGTVDALLVIEGEDFDGLDPGQVVEVRGTVHQDLDLAVVAEDLDVDLDEALQSWAGVPYLIADELDTSGAT